MAQYQYTGPDPETVWEDDVLTVVRPGDVRDDDPGWGLWTPLPDAAESPVAVPSAPAPAPAAVTAAPAATAPPATTPAPNGS